MNKYLKKKVCRIVYLKAKINLRRMQKIMILIHYHNHSLHPKASEWKQIS